MKLMEYTEEEKKDLGIPATARASGGKWYSKPDGEGEYLGKVQNDRFVKATPAEKQADAGERKVTPNVQPVAGLQQTPTVAQNQTTSTGEITITREEESKPPIRYEKIKGGAIDTRLELSHVHDVVDAFNTDTAFDGRNIQVQQRLKEKGAKQIQIVTPNDVLKQMGLDRGSPVLFPRKYLSALAAVLSYQKGPFKITDLTGQAGAGTLESTLGELLTLMGSTIEDVGDRDVFFTYIESMIDSAEKAGGKLAIDRGWVRSARASCHAFHRRLRRISPGGYKIRANFWDVRGEAEQAGVRDYAHDKGKSTDINTIVECYDADGLVTIRWEQPSLKKDKNVNGLNGSTTQVFALAVSVYGSKEEKDAYRDAGTELDRLAGLDDNAIAIKANPLKNSKNITVKQRKTELNKKMRAIEEQVSKNPNAHISDTINPTAAKEKQTNLHHQFEESPAGMEATTTFLKRWKKLGTSKVGREKQLEIAREIQKRMGQEKDKGFVTDLMKQFDNIVEKSIPDSYSAIYDTFGIANQERDSQKLGMQLLHAMAINGSPVASQTSDAIIANSHDHAEAVLHYLVESKEHRDALLGIMGKSFPLQDLIDGRESAILGEGDDGINLDQDTIKKCLGVETFDEVEEKLVIHEDADSGEPILYYVATTGKEMPISTIRARPDGVGYGGSWKLEMNIHKDFIGCCAAQEDLTKE